MEHLLQRFQFGLSVISINRFQSLFLWNIYFNNETSRKKEGGQNGVSILIFMEHLLQPQKDLRHRSLNGVSILIFMEHLLQPAFIIFRLVEISVSILIFMEHLLQR